MPIGLYFPHDELCSAGEGRPSPPGRLSQPRPFVPGNRDVPLGVLKTARLVGWGPSGLPFPWSRRTPLHWVAPGCTNFEMRLATGPKGAGCQSAFPFFDILI
jgi:hypothetical protein